MVKIIDRKVSHSNGRYYLTVKTDDTNKWQILGVHEWITECNGEHEQQVLSGPYPETVKRLYKDVYKGRYAGYELGF